MSTLGGDIMTYEDWKRKETESWEQDLYDETTYGDHSCFSEDFRPHKNENEEGMIPIVLNFVEQDDEDLPF